MLDNLKNHIESNREEFEPFSFDTKKGWKEISPSLRSSDKWPFWKIMSAAACIILVAAGSIYQLNPKPENTEIAEIENYYQSEINHKITLVKSQLGDAQVLEDLEEMDKAFAELKSDLKDNVDNEEVIQAMMENYQLKLKILEEILNELEKENSATRL